jgi:hypothetical protein
MMRILKHDVGENTRKDNIALFPICGVTRALTGGWTGQDRTGQDRTGQDRTGQDRTGQDRTGHLLSFIKFIFLSKEEKRERENRN